MLDSLRVKDAATFGVTRSMLRGRSWEHPTRGVYSRAASLATSRGHAEAFALVLPRDSGFGHLTGAALRNWWLPWLPTGVPLLATTRSGVHVHRPGLYLRRSRLATFAALDGISVVHPAECLLEMAIDLSIIDLVPMIDIALRAGACTPDDIARVTDRPRRGTSRLRCAMQLADPRSESAWESILRLLHVLCGISVEPQALVTDATGAVIARADLLISGSRRLAEYDGSYHRDRERHGADLAREKALARGGHERYGYTAAEIVRRPSRIIADAEAALALPHEASRMRPWLAAAAQSTLTPQGRCRLRERLQRYVDASRR